MLPAGRAKRPVPRQAQQRLSPSAAAQGAASLPKALASRQQLLPLHPVLVLQRPLACPGQQKLAEEPAWGVECAGLQILPRLPAGGC